MTRDEVIAGLRDSHQEFMDRLEGAAARVWEAPLPSGTWRVRDLAAHIAVWDRGLAADVPALLRGTLPAWLSWDDAMMDEVNERQVRDCAAWPIEQLQTELRQARAALLDTITSLDERQFAEVHRVGDAETSVEALCAYWIRHDRAHSEELPRA